MCSNGFCNRASCAAVCDCCKRLCEVCPCGCSALGSPRLKKELRSTSSALSVCCMPMDCPALKPSGGSCDNPALRLKASDADLPTSADGGTSCSRGIEFRKLLIDCTRLWCCSVLAASDTGVGIATDGRVEIQCIAGDVLEKGGEDGSARRSVREGTPRKFMPTVSVSDISPSMGLAYRCCCCA